MWSRISPCLDNSIINGLPATQQMFIASAEAGVASWGAFKANAIQSAVGKTTPVIVVGEVTEYRPSEDGDAHLLRVGRLRLRFRHDGTGSPGKLGRLVDWLNAYGGSAHEEIKLIAVLVVNINPEKESSLVAVGGLLMSAHYMFAESLDEAGESNRMYAAGVDHEKCVVPVHGYGFIPDYLVHGFRYLVLVERWGLIFEAYREHMQRKVDAAKGVFPLVESDVLKGRSGLPKYPEAIHEAIKRHEQVLGIAATEECDASIPESVERSVNKVDSDAELVAAVERSSQNSRPSDGARVAEPSPLVSGLANSGLLDWIGRGLGRVFGFVARWRRPSKQS